MTVLAGVLAAAAALLHVYIWVLESFRWTEPATRRTFGVSERDAPVLAPMAYNQGFYNLFLALVTIIGIVATAIGSTTAGLTMVLVGTGSMVAAGLVLLISSPAKASAALKQLVLPALAVVAILVDVMV